MTSQITAPYHFIFGDTSVVLVAPRVDVSDVVDGIRTTVGVALQPVPPEQAECVEHQRDDDEDPNPEGSRLVLVLAVPAFLFTVRSSDDRALAAALLTQPSVFGAELVDGLLAVRVSDFGGFGRALAPVARDAGIRLFEVTPTDDSLESVFSYLVRR